MAVVRRLLRILLALLASAAVGATIVANGVYLTVRHDPDLGALSGWLFILLVALALTVVIAGLPALLAVAYAEFRGRRARLFYLAVGGLIGLIAPLAAAGVFAVEQSAIAFVAGMTALGTAAGAAAGYVYWALAGRHAGAWR